MPSSGPPVRKMGEVLDLRTNHDIRDYGEFMSHTKLARFMGSNRLGLVAYLTGVAINVTFAQLVPPFYALAAVNAWQSGVGFVNRHCIRKEIKRRFNEDPRLKDLFKGRRRRAVFTGVCLKVFTAVLDLGLEDLGSMADAFVKHEGVDPDDLLPSAIIDDFKSEYPNLATADSALHT